MIGSWTRKAYGPPPSYEQNIRERQFKRKSYAYLNGEERREERGKVEETLQREFSFEDIRSRVVEEKVQQQTVLQQNVESLRPTQKRENSKKRQFGLRASNINSISDKIADLLSMVHRDREGGKEQGKSDEQQKGEDCAPYVPRPNNRQSAISQFSAFDNVSIVEKQGKVKGWMQMAPVLAEIDNRIHEKLKRRLSMYEKQERMTSVRGNLQNQPQYGEQEHYGINTYQTIPDRYTPVGQLAVPEAVKRSQELMYIKSGQQLMSERIKDKPRLYHYTGDLTENVSLQSKRYPQDSFSSINKERREVVAERNRELDSRITRINNEILERSLRNQSEKAGNSVVAQTQSEIFQHISVSQGQQQSKPTILGMAQRLSKFIDTEIQFRNLRESFEYYSDAGKWQSLLRQFKIKALDIDEAQLRRVMAVSIHEKNPFKNKVDPFPENGGRELVRLYRVAEQFWARDLERCVSADQLKGEGFQMALIDINKKGAISIEDLVCFVNVNSRRFYRSRDLASTFHRFLLLQGKSLERHIAEGVQYSTFMRKLTE